jgi:aryl-alcohol dehydrogenase-like predicted oxidoreductase
MLNRRQFLGITAGASAGLALSPELLRALQHIQQSDGTLIQRTIPSTGEKLPVVGLMFQNSPSQDLAAVKEVLKTMVDNGGKFLDTMHQSAPGVEDRIAGVVTELGIQNKLFLGLRANPPGPGPYVDGNDPAIAKTQIDTLLRKFKVDKLDLVQLWPNDDPAQLAVLREAKKQGRIRYIGVTTIYYPIYNELEAIMRNEPIDFIGVDYAVDQRRAEEKILPLAQERKIGVVSYFPFGINVGALFRRVKDTPLPEWAAEFDAKTWAQFFIKYVISHPAVTVVRTGTSQAKHMLDNIGGGMGRLPDEAMRKRMAEFIDAIPPAPLPPAAPPPKPAVQAPPVVVSAEILDRYVGEYKTAAGSTLTIRRDGTKLLVKPGQWRELPLVARSETRFADPRGPIIEFQIDSAGTVTGLIVEEPSRKTSASRVR